MCDVSATGNVSGTEGDVSVTGNLPEVLCSGRLSLVKSHGWRGEGTRTGRKGARGRGRANWEERGAGAREEAWCECTRGEPVSYTLHMRNEQNCLNYL